MHCECRLSSACQEKAARGLVPHRHWQRARVSMLLILRMHMDRGCGMRTCRNQPAGGSGWEKVRVAKSRQMPRKLSPSRLSCRLAVAVELRFIKFNLASRAYQTKLLKLEGLARPRALPRPPPYGAVERSARAWSPALQAGPVLIRQFHPSESPRPRGWEGFLAVKQQMLGGLSTAAI